MGEFFRTQKCETFGRETVNKVSAESFIKQICGLCVKQIYGLCVKQICGLCVKQLVLSLRTKHFIILKPQNV